MNTILDILAGFFIFSCIISVLFIIIRTYFCCCANSENCSDACMREAAKDARLEEMYCGKETTQTPVATKPKRVRKPKQIKKSSDAVDPKTPAKKKATRKKKTN